jgi:hypothetical protein
MLVTIKEIIVDAPVVKGKTRYQKASVAYEYNGQSRNQSVMSFSNPAVWKTLQELNPGDNVDVTITKNASGYNEWAAVEKVQNTAPTEATNHPAVKGTTTPAVRTSTYETPEERTARQLLIVRQSSLTNAIALHAQLEDVPKDYVDGMDTILKTAQKFVDFVYGTNSDVFNQKNDIDDVPY